MTSSTSSDTDKKVRRPVTVAATPTVEEHPVPWTAETLNAYDPARMRSVRTWPVLFMISIIALLVLSMMVIHSATITDSGAKFFWMQFIWITTGFVVGTTLVLTPLKLLRKYSAHGMVLIILPLAYLALAYVASKLISRDVINYFPFVNSIKGAVRWLRFPCPGIGNIQIQPSEFAKFFLLLYATSYYGGLERQKCRKLVPGVIIPSILCGAACFFILIGKDLSSTVIFGCTYFAIMFLAGVKLRFLLVIALLGISVGTMAILASPERVSRVTSYQNPEEDKDDDAFQLWRSQLALGSGGPFGRGYARGVIKTYLPEQHTDFIIAVMGEELGFVTVVVTILLYVTIFVSSVMIGLQCRRRPDLLFCVSFGIMIALQALVNISVVSGLCPTTGVTAPLLSYGGSSMMTTLALVGIIINIAWRNLNETWDDVLNTRCSITPGRRERRATNSPQ